MSDIFHLTLGLRPGASPAEIRTAFRRLALRYHPDRHGGDPQAAARFREIVSAYRVLSTAASGPSRVMAEKEPAPMSEPEGVSAPPPARSPVRRSSRVARWRSDSVDLGVLGAFLALMVAGLGTVFFVEGKRSLGRQRR